jgi:hypothetical protein
MRIAAVLLSFVFVSLLLSVLPASTASSGNYSFNVMNKTIGLNQFLFFNISAYFPQNVTYTVYINNTAILSGFIHADYPSFRILKYNVTNTLSGEYNASAKLSAVTFPLYSSSNFSIAASPEFSFSNLLNYTYIVNRTAKFNITLFDGGNTPLSFYWSLPAINGLAFSVSNYRQSFSLSPSALFAIPVDVNVTSSNLSMIAVNIPFSGTFGNTVINHSYSTALVSPVINLSDFVVKLTNLTNNTTIFSASFKNHDTIPVPANFSFFISLAGNLLYYSKQVYIAAQQSNISIALPISRVLNASISYVGANGTSQSMLLFSSPAGTSVGGLISNSLLQSVPYIVITAIILAIIGVLHLRFSRKGK